MPIVICEACGVEFERRQAEITRSKKKGRKSYCSLKCTGIANFKNIPADKRYNVDHLSEVGRIQAAKKLDEFSPFRWHAKQMRSHVKYKKQDCVVEVTLQDLKSQWDKQGGRCPYTGWELLNPVTTSAKDLPPKSPRRASLDRIDSSRGYTKDNIQFVALIAQYAKNDFAEADLLKFCKSVACNS